MVCLLFAFAAYRKALTALTRVIPKDGRQHNPLLPAYYFHHGQSIIKAIDDSQSLNDDDLITVRQLSTCNVL